MPNEIYRFLYKKLLALYPRAFREHFGDSMRQTFDDMCRERRGYLSLGFITWVAAETSFGIARERFIEFRKRDLMENARTNFALSALVGFLLILPFLILAFVFDISRRLETFSLRNAGDLAVMFGFMWIALTAIALAIMPVLRRNGTAAHADENAFTKFIRAPLPSAIISFALALPFLIAFPMVMLNIGPPAFINELLPQAEPDQPNILGAVFMLSINILAIVACLIARAPVVRAVRSGGSLFAYPFHLMLVLTILCIFASLVLGLIADQFPCWIGVPNCD